MTKSASVVKTFIEPSALTNFRKSIPQVFAGTSVETQLIIAEIIDSNLVVSVEDAVKQLPIICGVNTTVIFEQIKHNVNLGSGFEMKLYSLLNRLNLAIKHQADAGYSTENVPVDRNITGMNVNDLIPFVITGNADNVVEIAPVIENVYPKKALECLVFYYGMRVKHAKELIEKHSGDSV